jgi:hypothetical protein
VLFGKTKDQIWKIRETIMLINFKSKNFPQISEEDNYLDIADADNIDETVNLESAITIFQYLKDRYYKNEHLHLTITDS